ncbi:unnamed protein product [Phyllotreta striolata]|uniref:PH domain-containing protein n=1 Tax=Phyllotreta striolata TaxID=444603 RepID=A0A9N9XR25_PHYSR|nr:unnamed protein product [Phyllotreta striolata]
MDAFTENILARARERQKLLVSSNNVERTPLRENNSAFAEDPQKLRRESLSESNVHSPSTSADSPLKGVISEGNLTKFTRQNSVTRVSSEMPASPKPLSKTLNIQQDNFNMEIKVTSSDNVRVQVEIAETEENDDSEEASSDSGMRVESKSKLKRLGQLYAGGDECNISSPIHKTEAKFCANDSMEDNDNQNQIPKTPRKGLSKLADLANTINQWEDDLHHVQRDKKQSPKKTWKAPAPQPPSSSPAKTRPASGKPKAPEPPVNAGVNEVCTPSKKGTTQVVGAITKNVKWDQNVLDKLESQGFTRTDSSSRIVYSYNSQENDEVKSRSEEIPSKENGVKKLTKHSESKKEPEVKDKFVSFPSSPTKAPSSPAKTVPVHSRLNRVAEKAAIFEGSPTKSSKDPALLSVSERKALFEKNKGEALIPKAPFGMAPAMKMENVAKASRTKIINPEPANTEKVVVQIETAQSPRKASKKVPAPKPPVESPAQPSVPQSNGIASKLAALLENKSTISQTQIESSIKNERQKEMDMLLNRFNRNKPVTNDVIREMSDEDDSDDEEEETEETSMLKSKPAKIVCGDNERRRSAEKRKPYSKGDSPKVAAVLEDVKRIKVTGPKEGRLYPSLSDIEATTETETENYTRTPSPNNSSSLDRSTDSDDPNTSFGRDILQTVCKSQTPQKRPIYDESTASDISSILDDMDNYLDDLSNEDNASVGPTPPKQVRQVYQKEHTELQPSNSFSYKNCTSPQKTNKTQKSEPSPNKTLPEYIVEGDNVLPLTHTVSFYRKQQNMVQSPARQVTRQPSIEEAPLEEVCDESEQVERKIKELHEEIQRQQNVISQTSRALNLCSCTPEFSGSTEQVEAEKVLLLATHRRQAALHEIQRLKVERTIRPQGQRATEVPSEKGTLTITDILLPLKQKYVKALAAAGGKGHHIVCLIKCGEQVVPTKLTSTVIHSVKNPEADLIIPGTVVLHDVYGDLAVTFEVYCLQAQEEFLPHEVKYHISKKPGSKSATPKKSKQESKMVMPLRESPAGPQAVRSSSFALMGYAAFPVHAVNKKVWNLNNTPPMSPLEGTVEMKISCKLAISVEHRGFLTMFEDVSGFGAWHRRWCLLKGHTICYWKYPEDEKKTAPINSIDLKNCVTKDVKQVNREICARQHTFLLEMERLAYPTDKDSLVTICKGDKTIIRHLLSADTKEERVQWCTKLNASLAALRTWGNSH